MNPTVTMPRYFFLLGATLALLSFCTAIFGFSPFYYGFWNDEPIFLATLIISALSALWLASAKINFRLQRHNTLLMLWLAWLLWQTISTIFATNPWRAWFGPPEQSQGLAWYLCLTILMLQLSILWHSERFRKIILTTSFALMLALAILHYISDFDNNILGGFVFAIIPLDMFKAWMPFVWPDYLGAMAAFWWLALMLTFPNIRLRRLFAITLAMFFILLASSNHGAMVLVAYAMLITLTIRILHARGSKLFTRVSTTWRALAMLALLTPLFWLLASPFIPTNYRGDASQSIPARILLNEISLKAIASEPSRLLFGKGWGQFEDDFFKQGLVRDVTVYQNGYHAPNWGMIRGYNYHSHNMASESLLALGIPGLILWLLLAITAVRVIPAANFWNVIPMLVAARILAGLWFTMPQTLALQALCWFLLIQNYPAASGKIIPKKYITPACIAAALLLAWSASAQYSAIRYAMKMSDPFGQQYGHTLTTDDLKEDIKRGGDRLRAFFISTNKRMSRSKSLEPKHIALYTSYLQAMEALSSDPRTGAYNSSALLYGYNFLISNARDPLFGELQQHVTSSYFDAAKRHTILAPNREDIIAPFLLAMSRINDPEKQKIMSVVQELLTIHPGHRSALWVGGRVLSQQAGYEQQGLEMMRTALALGAARIYPIRPEDLPKP